jgi:hypothetical protein
MNDKIKALHAIRMVWFGPKQLTDEIIKELESNYQTTTRGSFATTCESWHGKSFLIDYKFNQITCINRGYTTATF